MYLWESIKKRWWELKFSILDKLASIDVVQERKENVQKITHTTKPQIYGNLYTERIKGTISYVVEYVTQTEKMWYERKGEKILDVYSHTRELRHVRMKADITAFGIKVNGNIFLVDGDFVRRTRVVKPPFASGVELTPFNSTFIEKEYKVDFSQARLAVSKCFDIDEFEGCKSDILAYLASLIYKYAERDADKIQTMITLGEM